MPFDVDAAFKAGATEDDVLGHLTKTRSFDLDGALKAGASKRDVIGYLSTTPPKQRGPMVPGAEKLGPLPGPAAPPLPGRLSSRPLQTPMEGQDTADALALKAGRQMAEYSPIEGIPQIVRGGREAFGPGRTGPQRAAGGTEMLRGFGRSVAPAVVPFAIANPLGTAAAIAGGMAVTEGTHRGLKAAGVQPEYAELAGEFAGAVVPVGAAGAKIASVMRGRRPVPEIPTPQPLDAGPVPKGQPRYPARESAEVLAREFPPVVKPARESAQVFMEQPLPQAPAQPPRPRPSTAAEAAQVFASQPKSAAESAQVLAAMPEPGIPSPKPLDSPTYLDDLATPKRAEESAGVFLDNLVKDAGPVPKGPRTAQESAAAFRPDRVSINIRPDDPRSTVDAVRDILGQQKPPAKPTQRVKAITEEPPKVPQQQAPDAIPSPEPLDVAPQKPQSPLRTSKDSLEVEKAPVSVKISSTKPKETQGLSDETPANLSSTTTQVGKVGDDPEVAVLPIGQILDEPQRFQFRSADVDRLEGVEVYDKNRGGVLSVWRDPADGQVRVVNGHNRLRKAKQLGEQNHRVQFIKADTADEARIVGALINISEGSASAVDAAKVFKQAGFKDEVLRSAGLSPKQKLTQQGMALSKLDDEIFTRVATGEIPIERGIVVGSMVSDPAAQRSALGALSRAEKNGKQLSEGEAREAVRFALSAPTSTQTDLFGNFEVNRYAEMGQVSDYIKGRMASERRLFSTVANAKSADKLGRTGNTIKADANAQEAQQLAQARELYDKMATGSGPINNALQAAALRIAESGGKNVDAIKSAAYDAVRPALEAEFSRIFSSGKGKASGPAAARQAAAPDAGVKPPDTGGPGAGPAIRPGGPAGVANGPQEKTSAVGAVARATDRPLQPSGLGSATPESSSGLRQANSAAQSGTGNDVNSAPLVGPANALDAIPLRGSSDEIPTPKPVDAPKHDYSSTQVELPPAVANRVREIGSRIPKHLLAEDGVETNPHVTVKYGLHDDSPDEVRRLLAGEGPVRVKVQGASVFDNPEFDVVKLDVDSPDLHRLNKKIADEMPHTDTHPEYKPHVTIAYVKKGEGIKLAQSIGAELKGAEIVMDSVTFSSKTGGKTAVPLRGAADEIPSPKPLDEPQQSLVTPAEEVQSRAIAKEDTGRLQAKQATQQIKFGTGKPLDAGKKSIEDSPLFGGERQGSMFDESPIGLRADKASEKGSITIPPATAKAIKEKSVSTRTALTDEFAAIENFTKEFGLKHEEDPYRGARMFAGVGGKIENRLNDLGNILRPAKTEGVLDDMKQYALYERYDELAQRGIDKFPEGKTIQALQAEKAALEQKLGPQKLKQVQGHINKLRTYMDGLLTEAKDAGIISDSAYNAIKANNQKYIPLQRLEYIADKLEDGVTDGSDSFSVAGQDLIKTIYGSEKKIADPLESILKNIYKSQSLIARNKVANQMADLATRPNSGVSQLPKSGVIPKGQDKFSALQNGVKKDYIAPTPVVDAMKRLNAHQMDIVTKAASLSSRALRAGATTFNAPFAIRNVFRDFQSAAINSPLGKLGFTPMDWMKGFAEAIRRGDDYRQFLEDGGSLSGYFERNKALPSKVKELTMGKGEKVIRGYVMKPWELIRLAGETSELAPRLGAYKRAKAKGRTGEESAYIARNVTVDFAKSGAAVKMFNLWVPFLNARIQGSINTATAFRDRPAKSALITSAMIGVPAIMTYLHNQEKYKEIHDDIAQFEKDANFLLIYGDKRDKDGNPTQVIKIAKGDVGRIFGNPLENFMGYLKNKNPRGLSEVAMQMASDFSPINFEKEGQLSGSAAASSITPPTAKGVAEGIFNKNLYTDLSIVPESMEDASPAEQYNKNDLRKPDTPEWLIKLGKVTNVSPLKWQNFMGTQFGSVGRQASELPSISRVGSAIEHSVHGARGGEKDVQTKKGVETAIRQDADERLRDQRAAGRIYKELFALPEDHRANRLEALIDNGDLTPEIVDRLEKLITKDEKESGSSIPERILARASSNARAIHIINRLRATPEDKQEAMLEDFTAKGLLTPAVETAIRSRLERESASQ